MRLLTYDSYTTAQSIVFNGTNARGDACEHRSIAVAQQGRCVLCGQQRWMYIDRD